MTEKQRELLFYIHRYSGEKNGVIPSFREMAEGVGLSSTQGIHRLLGGLEERGFIRRLPNRARAIEIIRMP